MTTTEQRVLLGFGFWLLIGGMITLWHEEPEPDYGWSPEEIAIIIEEPDHTVLL